VPQVFLVQQQRADGWLQVLLPVRPNGSTGWVRTPDVTLTANPFRIDVQLGAHTITVNKGREILYTGPIAVGATDPPLPDVGKPTPTPTGEYYPPGAPAGTRSEHGLRPVRVRAVEPFRDARLVRGQRCRGRHPRQQRRVGARPERDPRCIRMDNDAITMLAKRLPLGTPVTVTA